MSSLHPHGRLQVQRGWALSRVGAVCVFVCGVCTVCSHVCVKVPGGGMEGREFVL